MTEWFFPLKVCKTVQKLFFIDVYTSTDCVGYEGNTLRTFFQLGKHHMK